MYLKTLTVQHTFLAGIGSQLSPVNSYSFGRNPNMINFNFVKYKSVFGILLDVVDLFAWFWIIASGEVYKLGKLPNVINDVVNFNWFALHKFDLSIVEQNCFCRLYNLIDMALASQLLKGYKSGVRACFESFRMFFILDI